jgi:hypothetical protein
MVSKDSIEGYMDLKKKKKKHNIDIITLGRYIAFYYRRRRRCTLQASKMTYFMHAKCKQIRINGGQRFRRGYAL